MADAFKCDNCGHVLAGFPPGRSNTAIKLRGMKHRLLFPAPMVDDGSPGRCRYADLCVPCLATAFHRVGEAIAKAAGQ
jgi:hypothetical protein